MILFSKCLAMLRAICSTHFNPFFAIFFVDGFIAFLFLVIFLCLTREKQTGSQVSLCLFCLTNLPSVIPLRLSFKLFKINIHTTVCHYASQKA